MRQSKSDTTLMVKNEALFLSGYPTKQRATWPLLIKCSLLILLTLGANAPLLAQKTKAQLQKEKKENLQKIKEAQATLQKTSAQRDVSIGQLNAYQFQINAQANLIANYKSEISLLNNEIEQDQQIIDALENDVVKLKEEYGAMVYAAYKASKGQDKLTFLFSSNSFNQFFRRMHYLEQYTEARRKQVDQINAVREMLASQINAIEVKKTDQITLLSTQLKEKNKLEVLRGKAQEAVSSLASREKELKKEIEKRNKSLASLDKLIDNIIAKEIKAAAAAAKKSKALKSSATVLSTDFARNKAKLNWPVNGFISQRFGISKDPVLKGVQHNNPGIEIQTKPNSTVKCVSDGKISRVFIVQGFHRGVLVNHGDYFSVYAKLSTVTVEVDQVIKAGAPLGTVHTNSDGIAELHFEIWKSFTKLNPQKWLVSK